jgi:signal transduction histidine kinase
MIKTLLLEDNDNDAELVMRHLSNAIPPLDVEVKRVRTKEAFQQALATEEYDLILADFSLPQFGWPESLDIARSIQPSIPFVVVTGTLSEERAFELTKAGVSDYLLKSRLYVLPHIARLALERSRLLRERTQMLEELSKVKQLDGLGQISSGICHDVNNILAPVQLVLGMIRDELPKEHHRMMVDSAMTNVRRCADLMSQVTTMARRANGEKEPLYLPTICEQAMRLLRETLSKSITIDTQVIGELPLVMGNKSQLHSVFINLAVNARDAMPNGGKLTFVMDRVRLQDEMVEVQNGAEPVSGRFVRLRVTDTGTGIRHEIINRIFEPFFTTKPPGKGTGLGLSTTYSIVHEHHGYISVVSSTNGTTFTIWFPVSHQSAEPRPEVPTPQPPSGHGETILICDDEAAILESVRQILESYNYQILTALNGAEALRFFDEHGYAIKVLITDLQLPGISGAELIRAIHRSQWSPKIIVMTGVEPDQAGMSIPQPAFILHKPFQFHALLQLLHQVLKETA